MPELSSPAQVEGQGRLSTLEVEALAFRYPGTERGIRGISFALKRGTLTVVTGRVGSGKTTLLQVLLGLLPTDTGTLRWNGQQVETVVLNELTSDDTQGRPQTAFK